VWYLPLWGPQGPVESLSARNRAELYYVGVLVALISAYNGLQVTLLSISSFADNEMISYYKTQWWHVTTTEASLQHHHVWYWLCPVTHDGGYLHGMSGAGGGGTAMHHCHDVNQNNRIFTSM